MVLLKRLWWPALFLLLFFCPTPREAQSQDVFWRPTDGPWGGDIYRMAVDTARGVVLASNGGPLFYRAFDDLTWAEADLPSGGTSALAVDPSGGLFAAKSRTEYDEAGRLIVFNTVYRSLDGGTTWAATGLVDVPQISLLVANAQGHLFASNSEGLNRSTDGGTTWTLLPPVDFSIEHLVFLPGRSLVAMSGYGFEVHVSHDHGDTWTKTRYFGVEDQTSAAAVGPDGALYVAQREEIERFVVRSDNAGRTWTRIADTLHEMIIYHLGTTANGHLLAGTYNNGLWRSRDRGETWETVPVPTAQVHTLAARSDGLMLVGTPRGVYQSRDHGSIWTALDHGLRATRIEALLARADGTVYAGTYHRGLFRSNDGQTWTPIDLPAQYPVALHDTGEALFVGTWRGLFRSDDGLTGWQRAQLTHQGGVFEEAQIKAFITHPDGRLYASVSDYADTTRIGVYRADHTGQTWTQTGLHKAPVAFTALDGGTLLAATEEAFFALREDGVTWDRLPGDSLLFQHRSQVAALAAHPRMGVVAALRNGPGSGLYRLDPDSVSWARLAFGDTSIYALTVNERGHLFAATQEKVYRSNDEGQHWIEIGQGLDGVLVQTLALDADGTLFAGTARRGVYRSTPALTITASVSEDPVPEAIMLARNYPNPFHRATTIPYTLSHPGPVRLTIYDVLGRHVATLIDAQQEAGAYVVHFDGAGLPSGPYFYTLETSGRRQTRALLLVK